MRSVFIVSGIGDNTGNTVQVFTSRKDANQYAKKLHDVYSSRSLIVERTVNTKVSTYARTWSGLTR